MPKSQYVIDMLHESGAMRAGEFEALGISREYLRRLADAGCIVRESRGLYRLPESEVTIHHSLVEAARRVRSGVICLLSALRFHDLTTQNPFEVWMALESKAWAPQVEYPPLRVIRMSGAALSEGVETHTLEGTPLHVFGIAKTVVDCFKFRNKYGLDVALEALAKAIRQRRVSTDDIWRYATICRMTTVMRPYLEAICYG